jgi:hypothetical protein
VPATGINNSQREDGEHQQHDESTLQPSWSALIKALVGALISSSWFKTYVCNFRQLPWLNVVNFVCALNRLGGYENERTLPCRCLALDAEREPCAHERNVLVQGANERLESNREHAHVCAGPCLPKRDARVKPAHDEPTFNVR